MKSKLLRGKYSQPCFKSSDFLVIEFFWSGASDGRYNLWTIIDLEMNIRKRKNILGEGFPKLVISQYNIHCSGYRYFGLALLILSNYCEHFKRCTVANSQTCSFDSQFPFSVLAHLEIDSEILAGKMINTFWHLRLRNHTKHNVRSIERIFFFKWT